MVQQDADADTDAPANSGVLLFAEAQFVNANFLIFTGGCDEVI